MRNKGMFYILIKRKKKKERMDLLFCHKNKLEYFLHEAIRSIKFERSIF